MNVLPAAFVQEMAAILGPADADALCESLLSESPVSIRLNPLKPSRAVGAMPVPWCATGRYLDRRPPFTFDPLLHAGAYYVQEASSMFVEQAFRRMEAAPRRVLDLCAAPGGKSTLWRSLLPEGALLVANEPLRQRASVLVENLAKWGHPDTLVTNAFPADFARLEGFFDVVAADVPCSGEGMFRKDEGAVSEWSEAVVRTCAERQRKIVADVWPALREGGYLVYSTCTYNREEDERNVDFICRSLGAEACAIDCPEAWGVSGATEGDRPVCHFFPHRTRGEGFFLALLRKQSPAGVPGASRRAGKSSRRAADSSARLPKSLQQELRSWLRRGEAFRLQATEEGEIRALRETLADDAAVVSASVRTLAAGIAMAELKGRKTVPSAALALSAELASGAFPRVDLPCEAAIACLRRETLVLPPETPRGCVVAAFGGLPLGFLNNLGSRANNLYPQEWRIRSTYVREAPKVVEPT